jgi:hypothetical protein
MVVKDGARCERKSARTGRRVSTTKVAARRPRDRLPKLPSIRHDLEGLAHALLPFSTALASYTREWLCFNDTYRSERKTLLLCGRG